MANKKERSSNMRLAGVFIVLVLGLIVISIVFKLFLIIKNSKFDGNHKFNVEIIANDKINVVSFSPTDKSLTMLSINDRIEKDNLSRSLEIPIDGKIILKDDLKKDNLSSLLLKNVLPLGNSIEKLTIIDLIRLSLFSRSISGASVHERQLSSALNEAQKATVISLSFTDPTIYQENKTIEIINSSDIYGLGGRLANFISNMGGNVLLVSSGDKKEKISKIIYSGKESYTVRKLSSYLNFPLEKGSKEGIADVTIILGKDSLEKLEF